MRRFWILKTPRPNLKNTQITWISQKLGANNINYPGFIHLPACIKSLKKRKTLRKSSKKILRNIWLWFRIRFGFKKKEFSPASLKVGSQIILYIKIWVWSYSLPSFGQFSNSEHFFSSEYYKSNLLYPISYFIIYAQIKNYFLISINPFYLRSRTLCTYNCL